MSLSANKRWALSAIQRWASPPDDLLFDRLPFEALPQFDLTVPPPSPEPDRWLFMRLDCHRLAREFHFYEKVLVRLKEREIISRRDARQLFKSTFAELH